MIDEHTPMSNCLCLTGGLVRYPLCCPGFPVVPYTATCQKNILQPPQVNKESKEYFIPHRMTFCAVAVGQFTCLERTWRTKNASSLTSYRSALQLLDSLPVCLEHTWKPRILHPSPHNVLHCSCWIVYMSVSSTHGNQEYFITPLIPFCAVAGRQFTCLSRAHMENKEYFIPHLIMFCTVAGRQFTCLSRAHMETKNASSLTS